MKRKKLLLISILISALVLTGCSFNLSKKVITPTDFQGTLETDNYIVGEATNQFSEYDYVKKVLIAQNPTGKYQIEYYYFDNAENAKSFFDNNVKAFKKLESITYVELNGTNYSKYTQNTKEKYSVVIYVENTAIYVNADAKYSDKINEELDKLGY